MLIMKVIATKISLPLRVGSVKVGGGFNKSTYRDQIRCAKKQRWKRQILMVQSNPEAQKYSGGLVEVAEKRM